MRKAETSPSFESLVKNPGGSLRNERKCPPNKSVLTVGGWGSSIAFIVLILAEDYLTQRRKDARTSERKINYYSLFIKIFVQRRLLRNGVFCAANIKIFPAF